MFIGVVKESKNQEYRVGLTPAAVRDLVELGHDVMIESNAGQAIGFGNDQYQTCGASIADTAEEVWGQCDMIVKVKEPQPKEYPLMREGQILFAYLHLAAERRLAEAMLKSGVIGVAFETVTDSKGRLPLLAPMSRIAGRISVQEAARFLTKPQGGLGVLLGGVAGVYASKVVIIGAGVSGTNALEMAFGLGASVHILDKSLERLSALNTQYGGSIQTLYSNNSNLERALTTADVVIGSVLIPGDSAPKIVKRSHLPLLNEKAVLVDISIDQGGCFEMSKPTTHDDPVYDVDGRTYYTVANMPGAVSYTSTLALNNELDPYVEKLAAGGKRILIEDPGLRDGLNVAYGKICNKAVSHALNMKYVDPSSVINL